MSKGLAPGRLARVRAGQPSRGAAGHTRVRTALTLGVLAARAGPVLADDVQSIHLSERAEDAALPAPLLQLDPVVRPNAEGLGDSDVHHQTQFELPAGFQLVTDTVERHNELDVATDGWRVEGWLHRDLGFATLSVGGGVEHIDSRYLHGTYREVGAALTRTFAWSNGRVAWIQLSIGQIQWRGAEPPKGEDNSTQVMLSAGTTF